MDITRYQILDIRDSLDAPTTEALKIIEEVLPVEFRLWNEGQYSSIIKTIDVPSPFAVVLYYQPLSLAKIYHELLHLHCSLAFGYNSCMLPQESDNYLYKSIVNGDFCEYFLNNAEHTIIYDYYLEADYQSDDFFEPFDDPAIKVNEFLAIPFKNNGKYSITMVQNYLKLCTYLLSFPLDNRCQPHIKRIRSVEYPLFALFNQFFRKYAHTELLEDNGAYIQQCYLDLRNGIDNWIQRNKSIIVYP